MQQEHAPHSLGIAGRIAAAFINSPLTALVVATSIMLGALAVWLLPREEEPQIKVPMIDVMAMRVKSTTAKVTDENKRHILSTIVWFLFSSTSSFSSARLGLILSFLF